MGGYLASSRQIPAQAPPEAPQVDAWVRRAVWGVAVAVVVVLVEDSTPLSPGVHVGGPPDDAAGAVEDVGGP